MVQMLLLPDCHPAPPPCLSLTHTQYLGVTPIHTASSVHPSVFPSFLSTGKDLALGDKFLFDECTLWECFILTDYFYLFNVIFKIFIFYTEGILF